MNEIRIEGIITAPVDISTFTTALLKWVESKGYTYAGSIGPFYDNEDNDLDNE